jgi:hypothetical protein
MAKNEVVNISVQLLTVRRKIKNRRYLRTRKWILLRKSLGASGILLKELTDEDAESFRTHFRTTSVQFETLLKKRFSQ